MGEQQYILNNGEFFSEGENNINVNNRGFHYGDGLFESIRVIHGKPWCLDAHLSRLFEGMEALKIRRPADYTNDYFNDQINKLLEKNGISEGGRVRLTVFRDNGGYYTPENNDPRYVIEAYPLEINDFQLNEEGLKVDLYQKSKMARSAFSRYKTCNSLPYIMAGLWAKEQGLDDCLLQNSRLGIIEASSSNIFIVSNGVLYTPGLSEGCLGGVMRMQVINLAIQHDIKVYECNLTPQNLLVADELFLTNAITGLKWVASYRTKRYFNNCAKDIVNKLNESTMESKASSA